MRSQEFYRSKCIEHLDRVWVSYCCAKAAPIDLVTGISDVPAEAKRVEFVNEVHFVALKTNFELFLTRSLKQVWLEHFDQLRIKDSEKVSLADVGQLNSLTEVREFVIDKLVPGHGLSRIGKAIQEVTGVSLPAICKRAWPQIAVTFGIRHLIEHGNGRVDMKFERDQQHHWNGSSFARNSMPEINAKVVVQEEDIRQSYEAMKTATSNLSLALSGWTPG